MDKKIIITTVITLLVMMNTTLAQVENIKPGYHRSDPYCKKFVGTWKWEKGNDSFELILSYQKIYFIGIKDVTSDAIVGYHKFIKNGNIIEDVTPYKNLKYDPRKGKSTLLGSTEEGHSNFLKGTIIHISKDKSIEFEIKYIDSNHIKLVEVYNMEGTKISTDEHPYDSSISLPQNIVLTRVK